MKKRLWYAIGIIFFVINIVSILHAYKFTHTQETEMDRTLDPEKLSIGQKISVLLFGINSPKPNNTLAPSQKFETIILNDGKKLECWSIKTENSIGTVILFHGYLGNKSELIDSSNEFLKMGYNTLLVDFVGSGGSEGNQTTIGYFEAEQVKRCFDYVKNQGEKNIYLYGHSMGAAAILKSIHDYQLPASGIIIECPFGSMYQTTCNRFEAMKVPSFPMAGLLVFWGGALNGFWAFNNNPAEYAKQVKIPTLLLYGEKDLRVKRSEIDKIYANLAGKKQLVTFELAGHENFLKKYKNEWLLNVAKFMN